MPKKLPKRLPTIIDTAEVKAAPPYFDAKESGFYLEMIAGLSSENEELKAKLAKATAERDYEAVRAQLMEPYANKVYSFLVVYCSVVGLMIVAQGFRILGFTLPDNVLSVIAGSTAAAAIGLVGFVVSGLFKQPLKPLNK